MSVTEVNEVLPAAWSERVTRVRLGIEPLDALGRPGPVGGGPGPVGGGISPVGGLGRPGPIGGLGLHIENVPLPHPLPASVAAAMAAGAGGGGGAAASSPFGAMDDAAGLPGVARSPSGRFALAFGRAFVDAPPDDPPDRLVVRLVDPRRRYVPRRLSIPVPDLPTVRAAEAAHEADPTVPLTPRACRPALFPAAAYGEAAGATIVRGRVTWGADGSVVKWARVVARTATPIEIHDDNGDVIATIQPVLGRAHGDDRGEFLLVIGALPKELAIAKVRTVDLEIQVTARPEPAANAPVDSPTASRADPLWHLPIEKVGSLDPADLVAAGITTPGGYTASVTGPLTCRRGGVTRPAVPFVLP